MANRNGPAGDTGGQTGASGVNRSRASEFAASLPDKLRVHALAKLLAVSSRELMATLTELGVAVRSAQSSIGRETATRAAQVLLPDPDPAAAGLDAGAESDLDPAAGTSAAGPPAPVFNVPAPMFLSPSATSTPAADDEFDDSDQDPQSDDSETESGSRRRRRRGRRGRGRGRGGEGTEDGATDSGDGAADNGGESVEEQTDDSDAGDSADAGGRRRRRRRRRRDGGAEDNADSGSSHEDDPPDTVVHVRDSKDRSAEDEVQSVRGSTRLEAKRQRRRDGREAGRRRAPILSESEFLTRRESVARTMVVREEVERTQIAVLEDDVLVEHFVTTSGSGSLVGNVYLGKVQNVLPSMEAAFVDIGRGRNAVLYAGEVDWDAAGLEGKARRIEQALSSGDSVLVQVTKDPVGHKGARLTTQISLPGRFLVYVPGGRATGISRKLPDNERKRLKDVLKRIVPEDAGVIIRTASEGVSEEELARDVRRLQAQWEVIQGRSGTAGSTQGKVSGGKVKAPELLYEEPDLLVKVVRDLFTEDFRELVVQGEDAWDTVECYVQHVAPELMPRVRRYTVDGDVFSEYRIDEQITKALDRKVWLPSGGYLVIDRTEAMTVIDVNTGKFTGSGGNLEETVTRNNLEAAEEIIRQLRLRDVGGIIVIDFIDMVLESNRDLVLRRLTECLGRDRTRHQVAEVTSLGLVQMTRKKVGIGLLEAHSTTCEHCKGRGVMISAEPVNVRGTASSSATAARDSGGGSSRRSRSRNNAPAAGAASAAAAGRPAVEQEGSAREAEPDVAEPQLAAQAQPAPEAQPAAQAQPTPQAQSAAQAQPAAEAGVDAAVAQARGTVDASESQPVPDAADTAAQQSATNGPPDPAYGNVVNGAATPAAEDQSAVPTQPSRTTNRRRRAASRPAGPPATDQADDSDSDAQVHSAVQQAG